MSYQSAEAKVKTNNIRARPQQVKIFTSQNINLRRQKIFEDSTKHRVQIYPKQRTNNRHRSQKFN